jgi:hypothetical protein
MCGQGLKIGTSSTNEKEVNLIMKMPTFGFTKFQLDIMCHKKQHQHLPKKESTLLTTCTKMDETIFFNQCLYVEKMIFKLYNDILSFSMIPNMQITIHNLPNLSTFKFWFWFYISLFLKNIHKKHIGILKVY